MPHTSLRKPKASDLGYWHWSQDGHTASWRWRYEDTQVNVYDREAIKYGRPGDVRRGTFVLRLREDLQGSYPTWTLTTCGTTGKGGTRHRYHLDLTEAQRIALAWMDRRFKVEMVAN